MSLIRAILESCDITSAALMAFFTLHESAVSDCEGVRPFSSEPTGRFGGLDAGPSMRAKARTITVQVEHVNTVLERVLSSTEIIDLLKIDTEGSEVATVRAIEPRLLARIRHIVIESRDHRMQIDGFRTEARCDAVRFTSEKLSG